MEMDKTKTRWVWIGALASVLAMPTLAWTQPGVLGPDGPDSEHEEEFDEELPAKEREALFRELRENNPEGFRRLQRMRKARPRQFRRRMRGLRPMLRDPRARELMRKGWKADARLHKLLHAFKTTEKRGEKDKLKGDIRELLNEQFDAKLKGHELHLKEMEKRIAMMKERIAKRKKLKKKIVERYLGRITGDEEGWDW
jgi:hypothetical protein